MTKANDAFTSSSAKRADAKSATLLQDGNGGKQPPISAPPAEATSADNSANTATDVAASADGTANVKVEPLPQLPPKRRVELSTVAMSALPEVTPVESLMVRELKGIGSQFTPNLDQAMQFHVLVYKPEGEFEATNHIIAGELLQDPRITSRAKVITFVPAFAWSTCEIVIHPIKMTKFGVQVLHSLESLRGRFPHYKVFVEWSDRKRRHVVNEVTMTSHERELISSKVWPTKEEILDALSAIAFENIDDLAGANQDICTLLGAREVE